MTLTKLCRLSSVLLAVLLSGCGPQIIGVVKSPDYSEKINGASVVFMPTQVESTSNTYTAGKSSKAISGFTGEVQKRVPVLAQRDGFSPLLITTGDAGFTNKGGYKKVNAPGGTRPKHFVVINPVKSETRCTATCRTWITVITSVYDTKLEKEVWQASIEVSEKSGLHTFDEADIDSFWMMLTGQLKESRLL